MKCRVPDIDHAVTGYVHVGARGRFDHDAEALTTSLAGWDRIGARFEHAYTLRLIQEL